MKKPFRQKTISQQEGVTYELSLPTSKDLEGDLIRGWGPTLEEIRAWVWRLSPMQLEQLALFTPVLFESEVGFAFYQVAGINPQLRWPAALDKIVEYATLEVALQIHDLLTGRSTTRKGGAFIRFG